jgi:hypothetical protein
MILDPDVGIEVDAKGKVTLDGRQYKVKWVGGKRPLAGSYKVDQVDERIGGIVKLNDGGEFDASSFENPDGVTKSMCSSLMRIILPFEFSWLCFPRKEFADGLKNEMTLSYLDPEFVMMPQKLKANLEKVYEHSTTTFTKTIKASQYMQYFKSLGSFRVHLPVIEYVNVTKTDFLNGWVYMQGHMWRDYKFYVLNYHPLLSMIFLHERHPSSLRDQRLMEFNSKSKV